MPLMLKQLSQRFTLSLVVAAFGLTTAPSTFGSELPLQLSPSQVKVLAEYLTPSNTDLNQRYKVEVEVTSNRNMKEYSDRAQDALSSAFAKTFGVNPENSEPLTNRLKANVVEALLKNFVYTLRAFGLVGAKIGVHLHFIPTEDDPDNLNAQFNNNNLVQFDDRSLLQELIEGQSRLQKISAKANSTKVGYQYLGGSINISVEIIDLFLRPEILKGQIQYRRHYAHQQKSIPFSLKAGRYGQIDRLHFGKVATLLTVDINKSFNYKNFTPQLNDMDISFGRLVAHDEQLSKGHLYLVDNQNRASLEIKRLRYNFRKNQFDTSPSLVVNLASGDRDQTNVQRALLTRHKSQLIQALDLRRFWSEL